MDVYALQAISIFICTFHYLKEVYQKYYFTSKWITFIIFNYVYNLVNLLLHIKELSASSKFEKQKIKRNKNKLNLILFAVMEVV